MEQKRKRIKAALLGVLVLGLAAVLMLWRKEKITVYAPASQSDTVVDIDTLSIETTELDFKTIPFSFGRFIELFNGEEVLFNGAPPYEQRLDRLKFLVSESVRQAEGDTTLKKFLNDVMAAGGASRIGLNDKYLFAKATCNGKYQGKATTVDFTLVYQNYPRRGEGWGIAGASADFLKGMSLAPPEKESLMPSAHELNFLRLGHDVEEHALDFAHANFQMDVVSVLNYLFWKKELEVGQVKHLRIFLAQLPEWIIEVEETGIHLKDGGWRIKGLKHFTDLDAKNCFLIDSLHLPQHSEFLFPNAGSCLPALENQRKEYAPLAEAEAISMGISLADSLVEAFQLYDEGKIITAPFIKKYYSIFESSGSRMLDDLTDGAHNILETVTMESYLSLLNARQHNGGMPGLWVEIGPEKPKLIVKNDRQYALVGITKHIAHKQGEKVSQQVVVVDLATRRIDCIVQPNTQL